MLARPLLWLFLIFGWREIKKWTPGLAKEALAKDQSAAELYAGREEAKKVFQD